MSNYLHIWIFLSLVWVSRENIILVFCKMLKRSLRTLNYFDVLRNVETHHLKVKEIHNKDTFHFELITVHYIFAIYLFAMIFKVD